MNIELDAADKFEIHVRDITRRNEHYCNFCFRSEFQVDGLKANFSGLSPIVAPLVRICGDCTKEIAKEFAAFTVQSVHDFMGIKKP